MSYGNFVDPELLATRLDKNLSDIMGTSLRSLTDIYDTVDQVQGQPGVATPSYGNLVLGSDGTNARAIKTTTDGKLVCELG